jgi:hypothetical protein
MQVVTSVDIKAKRASPKARPQGLEKRTGYRRLRLSNASPPKATSDSVAGSGMV